MSTNVLNLMAGGNATPNTADWWRDRLIERLTSRKKSIDILEQYHAGTHKLQFASPQFEQTFGELFAHLADNWMELVVSAAAERLGVTGFRFGDSSDADDAAWKIWQRNNMDAESSLAMTDAIKLGTSYAIVGADDDGKAIINIDHPADAITESYPMQPRKIRVGLRRWVEADGTTVVLLATETTTYRWTLKGSAYSRPVVTPNQLGVVPIVPIRNNPCTYRDQSGWRERRGVSDIDQVIGLNDAIDKLLMDMLVASEYAAFRQRYVTGMEIPVDPSTGEPLVDQWKAALNRIWIAEDPATKFGEFEATNLENYTKAVAMVLQHLSAQTRTPPHYLIGQIVNASGDALKAAETGLVAKVRGKQIVFGDDWEDVMRLAFLVENDTARATDMNAETIWRDPETRSQAEVTDSVIKLKTIGVPLAVLLEEYGFSPQKIARVVQLQREETLTTLLDNVGTSGDQGDPSATVDLAAAAG